MEYFNQNEINTLLQTGFEAFRTNHTRQAYIYRIRLENNESYGKLHDLQDQETFMDVTRLENGKYQMRLHVEDDRASHYETLMEGQYDSAGSAIIWALTAMNQFNK